MGQQALLFRNIVFHKRSLSHSFLSFILLFLRSILAICNRSEDVLNTDLTTTVGNN